MKTYRAILRVDVDFRAASDEDAAYLAERIGIAARGVGSAVSVEVSDLYDTSGEAWEKVEVEI